MVIHGYEISGTGTCRSCGKKRVPFGTNRPMEGKNLPIECKECREAKARGDDFVP